MFFSFLPHHLGVRVLTTASVEAIVNIILSGGIFLNCPPDPHSRIDYILMTPSFHNWLGMNVIN